MSSSLLAKPPRSSRFAVCLVRSSSRLAIFFASSRTRSEVVSSMSPKCRSSRVFRPIGCQRRRCRIAQCHGCCCRGGLSDWAGGVVAAGRARFVGSRTTRAMAGSRLMMARCCSSTTRASCSAVGTVPSRGRARVVRLGWRRRGLRTARGCRRHADRLTPGTRCARTGPTEAVALCEQQHTSGGWDHAKGTAGGASG